MSTNGKSRREFIRVSARAGGGFLLGVRLEPRTRFAAAQTPLVEAADFAPNAWIRIASDGTVTVMIDKSEMGQGVTTSLPMLVAEELEADWKAIRTEFAPADPVYNNTLFGMQATGGSSSVRSSWKSLRSAGAAAREMLVQAAAQRWGVDPASCTARSGEVSHQPSGRRLGYGELAAAAALLPVPKEPRLKDPKDFRVIGTRVHRLDTPAKVMGTATFGIDVKLPGLLTAVVARSPVFGGKRARHDASKAVSIQGVRKVLAIESGVAVVADGYWPAQQGRKALVVEWNEGANAGLSSATIMQTLRSAAAKPGAVARHEGAGTDALPRAARRIDAEYTVPYLAHATMEPMNCTAHVRADGCDVWAPTQRQDETRAVAARITGLAPEKVAVHTTYLGGGFGRKFETDFVAEAVEISKAMNAPVKVIWSREDDMQHDFYRTAAYNKLNAGLDAEGWPLVWTNKVVSDSSMARVFPPLVQNGLDSDAVEGAANLPYAIPNIHVEFVLQNLGVPVGFWRSVGSSQNAFITECFLDELAAATGKDPVEFRRRLLTKSPRLLGVLELAASKAGWGKPLSAGRHRGIAVHESFGSFVAQVAEVSITSGTVRVHRVVCAVDCGQVVNPDTVEAQMESGIVYGLTAALKGEITIDRGRVVQTNFNNYGMLLQREMPAIEVHIVPSTEPPGGVGEPGTPPIAPAVANAVRAATGQPVRSLPIRITTAMKAAGPRKG
jgi:isoquinoline 1-oxidoreductase subunit beta